MPALAVAAFRILGPIGIIALGVFVFYEGLPIGPLRHIPVVGPALETFTDGRVDRARKEGASAERGLWEEQRDQMLAQQEIERREKQAQIDEVARKLLLSEIDKRVMEERLRAELTAILKEEADAETAANPAAARRPAISRRVSRILNQMGR